MRRWRLTLKRDADGGADARSAAACGVQGICGLCEISKKGVVNVEVFMAWLGAVRRQVGQATDQAGMGLEIKP